MYDELYRLLHHDIGMLIFLNPLQVLRLSQDKKIYLDSCWIPYLLNLFKRIYLQYNETKQALYASRSPADNLISNL